MEAIIYILLGIIQGIFEWIPVSSQGISALLSQLLLKNFNPIDMALFLHLGTLFSVLVYFRKDWLEILSLKNFPLLRFLTIATIISLPVGFLIYQTIGNLVPGNTLLLIMGLGLFLTSFLQRWQKKIEIGNNKLAFLVGVLQGLSVIPGLSRSGATIFGLSLGKFSPKDILKISYLMSAPIVLIACFYLYLKTPALLWETWLSLIFSFLVGLVALHFLINLAQKLNFSKFTFIFGVLCLLGALIGFLS